MRTGCKSLPVVILLILSAHSFAEQVNLVQNPDFTQRDTSGSPTAYQLTGDAQYRYLGNPQFDSSGYGISFPAAKQSGSVTQTISDIDASKGRWYRFIFRGLPQDNFAVASDGDLTMRVEYFADHGRTTLDGKSKPVYPQIEEDRRNFNGNGDDQIGGAAVWRTYQLDFYLPFPQVDTVRIGVSYSHGSATRPIANEFFISNFRLTRLTDAPAGDSQYARSTTDLHAPGSLIALGGRWFYDADTAHPEVPKVFDHTNASHLLYHDSKYSAPFEGNMSAWLRAGDKDSFGSIALADQLVEDNVTVEFSTDAMIIHTKSLPNHPTGKFPETEMGAQSNPNYITERTKTYYIPLDPKVNPRHIVTASDNSNHALPMGPIGIAVNGVVFFNPFDANSQDASSYMDRCCGHPAPDGTYHYHKYPICINSPWSDDGKEHSPLIGWAFDGFPIYGPFESENTLAKDVKGAGALNDFNLHFDPDRGWHYHVTPGKFPYIIGGYWGYEDSRDKMRGPRGGGMGRGPRGGGGFGPPPF
jgi:hypothetical protein